MMFYYMTFYHSTIRRWIYITIAQNYFHYPFQNYMRKKKQYRTRKKTILHTAAHWKKGYSIRKKNIISTFKLYEINFKSWHIIVSLRHIQVKNINVCSNKLFVKEVYIPFNKVFENAVKTIGSSEHENTRCKLKNK